AAPSSYRSEPETAFIKPATDVVLVGHACARRPTTELLVSLAVGAIRKAVRVMGDRTWSRTLGVKSMSRPTPFERMPLVWERSFGGWDRSHADPRKHTFEPRNPVGRGFRARHGSLEDGLLLPNLEDPQHPLKSFTD